MRARAKAPRALAAYRSAPDPLPPAHLDSSILAAARSAAASRRGHRPLWFAGAMAATLVVASTARWFTTDAPPPDLHEYGLQEGQARDYLLHFDPLTTGPGSQEGPP